MLCGPITLKPDGQGPKKKHSIVFLSFIETHPWCERKSQRKVIKRNKGTRSSRHDPYILGYTRVTMLIIKSRKEEIRSKSQKCKLSSDCRLKLAYMKSESLVIVDQHATVNILGSCTHRPSRHESR